MSNVLGFLDLVREECANADVALIVDASYRSSDGVFDSIKKTLIVEATQADWLLVLAHEFAHFCQWKDGKFGFDDPTIDEEAEFDAWMKGKKLSKDRVRMVTRAIQRCELDAEIRAIKFIKKYGLTQGVEKYTKEAWLYVMGYEFARRRRAWWTLLPEKVPEIMARVPKQLPKPQALGRLDATLEHLIWAHCCDSKLTTT